MVEKRKGDFSLYSKGFSPFLMLIFFLGCSSMEGQWRKAQREDSIQAYEQFSTSYPQSPYEAQASERLKQLHYQKALSLIADKGYEGFQVQEAPSLGLVLCEATSLRVEVFFLQEGKEPFFSHVGSKESQEKEFMERLISLESIFKGKESAQGEKPLRLLVGFQGSLGQQLWRQDRWFYVSLMEPDAYEVRLEAMLFLLDAKARQVLFLQREGLEVFSGEGLTNQLLITEQALTQLSITIKSRLVEALFEAYADFKKAKALELLLAMLDDREPMVRLEVIRALAQIEDPKALDALGEREETDPDQWVREEARKALNRAKEAPQ